MGRRRVALVVASVALAAVGILAGIGVLVSRRSDDLLAAVGRGLGRKIEADHLGVSFWGGAGVMLSGVRIGDDPAFAAAEPFLSARSFEMRLRLLPLLRRRVVVDRILIEEPTVNLVRDAAGHLNVDSLGKPVATPGGAASAPPAPEPTEASAGGPPAFQLAMLRLRHGTVRYVERGSGRTVELSDVAADARQPRFEAPMPLSLRARLATNDLRLDDINSEGILDLASTPPSYRGSFSAGPGKLGELDVERLEAQVRAAAPVVELDSATAKLLGGIVTGKARLASEGPSAGFTARLDGQGLDLARLPAPPDRPRPAGTLLLNGMMSGPPPGDPAFVEGLGGEGRFEVAEGRLAGVKLGRGLLDALGPFLKPGVADRLRERYPDLFASDDLPFTRLSGSGRVARGRIRSEDLVVAGVSYEARGAGSLGFGGDIDALLNVSASPALTEDLLGDSRARAVLVDASGRLTIPLRVRGPVRRPHVSPDPSFAATAARGMLGGTGLEGLAGDVLERVFGGKRKK